MVAVLRSCLRTAPALHPHRDQNFSCVTCVTTLLVSQTERCTWSIDPIMPFTEIRSTTSQALIPASSPEPNEIP